MNRKKIKNIVWFIVVFVIFCMYIAYKNKDVYAGAISMPMAHWANVRDENSEIIGKVNEGDIVIVYSPDLHDPSRIWISTPEGIYGSVSMVYVFGGTEEQYLDPTSYSYVYEYQEDFGDYTYSVWENIEDYELKDDRLRDYYVNHDYYAVVDHLNNKVYVYDTGMLILEIDI